MVNGLWSTFDSVDKSNKLIDWTNYLIGNVSIKDGEKVYCQNVGILWE